MFKLISKLGMGNPCATNVQIIKNLSNYSLTIVIKSGNNTWKEIVDIGQEKRINATRNEIGEVTAYCTITFSTGRVIEYTFRIDPSDTTDIVNIYDDYVDYNSRRRGQINLIHEEKLIQQKKEQYQREDIALVNETQLRINELDETFIK